MQARLQLVMLAVVVGGCAQSRKPPSAGRFDTPRAPIEHSQPILYADANIIAGVRCEASCYAFNLSGMETAPSAQPGLTKFDSASAFQVGTDHYVVLISEMSSASWLAVEYCAEGGTAGRVRASGVWLVWPDNADGTSPSGDQGVLACIQPMLEGKPSPAGAFPLIGEAFVYQEAGVPRSVRFDQLYTMDAVPVNASYVRKKRKLLAAIRQSAATAPVGDDPYEEWEARLGRPGAARPAVLWEGEVWLVPDSRKREHADPPCIH